MKKLLSLLLAAMLLVSVSAIAAAEDKPLAGLEFSILCTTWSPYSTETTLIPAIEEATGAKINVEWALKTDFDTRVNAVLASNEIPDVIMGANYLNLLDQGAIIPLDEYLTEENTPNILKALSDGDYAFMRNVADGCIYEIPSVFDFPPVNSWVVRTDWMEKLGLKSLDTWEDWLTYWRGVLANDMNGNGDATDEIAIACNYKNLRTSFIPTSTTTGYFCVTDDGEYTVYYESPKFASYLETMVSLYQEGILRSENFTASTGDLKTIVTSGLGATMQTAAEWSMTITQALRETYPDAAFQCVLPITTPLGDQVINARAKISGRGVITVAGESKAADIMKLFDYLYSEEGEALMNFGVEGVHHEVVDGKKKLLSPYVDSFVNARGAGLIFQPFPFLWDSDNYMQILLGGKSYDELSEPQRFFYDGLFMNTPYHVVAAPTLATEAYATYGTDVFTTLTEAEANCITGNITIEEFWKTYEMVKTTMGLNEIIAQAADAWKVVNGK